MSDNSTLFTGKAGLYASSRPGYPPEIVDWLYAQTHARKVTDIGAGTGIFTRLLLTHPWQVCAVEPNADMLQQFKAALSDVPVCCSTGENTTLPDSSTDLITVAQAFHWLDEELFKQEAMRILRPGGKVAIIWNNRLDDGIAPARDAVCRKFCHSFRTGHTGKRSISEGDDFLRHVYLKNVRFYSCRHSIVYDWQLFLNNVLSRSYALSAEHKKYPDFIAELKRVFENFAVNSQLREYIESTVYLGHF